MINTLYLPELREMLSSDDNEGLKEFCTALHPGRTAEFMEGLTAAEQWVVLKHAELTLREEIFQYFPHDRQVEIIESQDRSEIAQLISDLSADDRVDLLHDVKEEVVEELMPLVPLEVRREILRLREYPEGTAGAMMTTEVAKLDEHLPVRKAIDELSRQAETLETIYYLYIVDEFDHLRGVVSARQLVSAIAKPDTKLSDLMESDVVSVATTDDQEEVAKRVAHFDLLAIPVVDGQRRLVGIITHDDVIDVVREEATEDAYRAAAVAPLDDSYLRTSLLTLAWKRGVWLTVLFFTALLTASALRSYEHSLEAWPWLIMFIPLVMSSGGNSGNQSATLVITAMSTGDVKATDWPKVLFREVQVGLILGTCLAAFGTLVAWLLTDHPVAGQNPVWLAIVPVTLVLVVTCGAVTGSILPMIFKSFGLDPALMSNPFVAGISDILAIVIYMSVALTLLSGIRT
jgi:magnesium transporter